MRINGISTQILHSRTQYIKGENVTSPLLVTQNYLIITSDINNQLLLLSLLRTEGVVLWQLTIFLNGVSASSTGFENSPTKSGREKTDILLFDFGSVHKVLFPFTILTIITKKEIEL